jgi:DNA-directed RNA polymerase specialized sigma24 family protein
MSKKQIFNSRKVGKLLEKYVRHPHDRELRAEIMTRAVPLIKAAITRKIHPKDLPRLMDDLQQECALKLFRGIRKYKAGRGSAFAFMWTIICNSLKTHGKRMSKGGLSLEEEAIGREAEAVSSNASQSPEYLYLQKVVSKTIDKALSSRELRVFHKSRDKEALAYIRKSVLNGDLFSKKSEVLKGLEELGIHRKKARFLADYVIVNVRANLYPSKEALYESVHRKSFPALPGEPTR